MDIYVRGYFYTNLGDDLFMLILANRYPKHRFHIIAPKEQMFFLQKQKNIIVHEYKMCLRVFDKITDKIGKNYYKFIEKKCELNIIISGSIFQESYSIEKSIKQLQSLPFKNKTFVLGTNFGPYYTDTYYQYVKGYLQKAEDVCFRDKWSFNKFSDLNNVRMAPDIIFGLENIYNKVYEEEQSVFFSIIDFENRNSISQYANSYRNFVISCIKYYISKKYRIVMASFCKFEMDNVEIEKILCKLSYNEKKSVTIIEYCGENWQDIISEIQKSKIVIATRFHSMILGMLYGKKVLPIVYNDKIMHFLESIGDEEKGVQLQELENYCLNEQDFVMLDNLEKIIQQSENHFKVLDKWLLNL